MANILVVDDEDNIRDLIAVALSSRGYNITKVADSTQVISKLEELGIDLLITDLVMPGKAGLDLILEIKNNNPRVKIIAISGGGGITGRFDYLPVAKLSGADRIIKKPFKLEELGNTVEELLATG